MLKSPRLSISSLVVICVIMGTVVAIEVINLPQPDRPQAITPPKPELLANSESPPAGNFSLPPLDAYREIAERPLFMSSRRPPQEPEIVQQKQPNENTSFTLLGVAVTPERTLALLQIDKGGKVARVGIGEEVNGWRLEAVRADEVTLRKNETVKNIPLVRKSKSALPPREQAAPHEKRKEGSAVPEEREVGSEAKGDTASLLEEFRKRPKNN